MKSRYGRIAGILLSGLLVIAPISAQAAQVQNGAVYEVTTNQLPEWPQAPEIASETGILMDADTGAILYNKGMDEIRYPASITKIMTCLLALEQAGLDDQVTFTQTVLSDPNAGGTNIGMQAGEILTMRQCLDVLMVQSANDVATQIAEYVGGGSVQAFVDRMNERAQELGCTNTHFANASGMPDENHYTTAHDMALIFQEAIKNETFLEIIKQQNVVIGPTNMNGETRTYSCHHALVAQSAPEYYEGCFGGKTGVTEVAKNTLVSGVTRNGMTLIAVTLRAEVQQIYQDQIKLFDYGFENFSRAEVPGGVVTLPANQTVENFTIQETEEGAETIHFFKNDISPAIQQDIDTFLKEKRYELKNEVAVKADYYRTPNTEYAVRCQVIEQDSSLIDLTVTVPTEAEAETIVNNWTMKNQEIYALVMSTLL